MTVEIFNLREETGSREDYWVLGSFAIDFQNGFTSKSLELELLDKTNDSRFFEMIDFNLMCGNVSVTTNKVISTRQDFDEF